jgi:hypothetical protein
MLVLFCSFSLNHWAKAHPKSQQTTFRVAIELVSHSTAHIIAPLIYSKQIHNSHAKLLELSRIRFRRGHGTASRKTPSQADSQRPVALLGRLCPPNAAETSI